MYIRTDIDLIDALEQLANQKVEDIFILAETSAFDTIFVQPLVRTIGTGQRLTFLALRKVEVRPQCRGQGHFKSLLTALLVSKHPILFDDVVNDQLAEYLQTQGWTCLFTEKYDYSIRSYYRLP